jgi:hypothetical protein
MHTHSHRNSWKRELLMGRDVTNEIVERGTSLETRATLIHQAFRVEYLTVVWMTVEALISNSRRSHSSPVPLQPYAA